MIQIKIGNLLEIRKFLKAQDFTDRTFVFVYNIVFPIIFALFAPSSLKLQLPVLPFLAIYRQIRDFGHRAGDKNLGLAMDRQSPEIRDF